MLNGALASFYGVAAPGGTGFGKVTFRPASAPAS